MTENYTGKFQQRLDDYARDYRIDELNQSNDRAALHSLIGAELMLEALQKEVERIVSEENLIEKASEVKKLSDLIRDMTTTVTTIQRTLAIDRKTRKSEETDNFAGWLRATKQAAKKFIEDRMVKIYCPDCKVMVGRYSPVHHHTAFKIITECSQCGKGVRANRDSRDIWFDLARDSEWRRKYPVEIINPSTKQGFNPQSIGAAVEDEFVIEGGDIIDGSTTSP
jgi:hypothetical protein